MCVLQSHPIIWDIQSHPIDLSAALSSEIAFVLKELREFPLKVAINVRNNPHHVLLHYSVRAKGAYATKGGVQCILSPKEAEDVISFALRYLLPDLLKITLMHSPWRVNSINSSIFDSMMTNPYKFDKHQAKGIHYFPKWKLSFTYVDYFMIHNIHPSELIRILIMLSKTCAQKELFDQPFQQCLKSVPQIMKSRCMRFMITKQRFRDMFMHMFNKRRERANRNMKYWVQRTVAQFPLPFDMIDEIMAL